ncbi:sulfurtransferase TusA family protein [Halothiobacillus sp. DCM-1]|uniref:sulfurtransferase TusA family protein n=1 Tax=Halothiobacillus sp. DCM-1 TaxID=3112558 RepID=UPI0032506260
MTTVLDARGLRCPLPLLQARKALSTLSAGARLTVMVSDPGAPADFTAYCAQTGHRLIEILPADEPSVCHIVLERGTR